MDALRGLPLTASGVMADTRCQQIRDLADEWKTYGKLMLLAAAFFVLLAIVTGEPALLILTVVIGYIGYEVVTCADNLRDSVSPQSISFLPTSLDCEAAARRQLTNQEKLTRVTAGAPLIRNIILSFTNWQ